MIAPSSFCLFMGKRSHLFMGKRSHLFMGKRSHFCSDSVHTLRPNEDKFLALL